MHFHRFRIELKSFARLFCFNSCRMLFNVRIEERNATFRCAHIQLKALDTIKITESQLFYGLKTTKQPFQHKAQLYGKLRRIKKCREQQQFAQTNGQKKCSVIFFFFYVRINSG